MEDVTPSCVEDAWENLKDRLLLGVEMFDNVFEWFQQEEER